MEEFASNATDSQKAIIRLVAFFDMFDYPETAFEIWSGLESGQALRLIRSELHGLVADGYLEVKNGFYYLPGREEIILERRARHNYSTRKVNIARRFAQLFGLCPWVKTVALANSIGALNLRDGSDIDFFIITSPGRVWLSRLYCTGLAKLLGKRPTSSVKRDKICLTFYLSSDRLAIDDLRLPNEDPYFDEWRRQLVLLYNKEDTFNEFLAANRLASSGALSRRALSRNQDAAPNLLERLARRAQLWIMPLSLKSAAGASDGVVISDQVLKFYQRDRRREFAEKYAQKIQNLFEKND